MSVDYRAGLVIGWKISAEERLKMNEISNYEYEDEFIRVDYYVDEPEFIFGEWLVSVFEGCVKPLNLWRSSENISPDFEATHQEMLRKMGRDDLAATTSTLFIIHQVS